jgi:DNA-binding NarL/FixJ family response regulator
MEQQKGATGTILIVDDHAPTTTVLKDFLAAALPACKLLTTASAEEAIGLCCVEQPHVVIMDIALPGVNGIEATRRIKALAPAVHVVMHSNYDMKIFHDECAAAGACAFVPKHKVYSDLLPAITKLLPSA